MRVLFVLLSVAYSNIQTLNHKNFQDFISENPYTLVEFFSPTCVQCGSEQLEPILQKIADTVKPMNITVVKVDGTQDKVLAAKNKVQGFPTLVYYRAGFRQIYDGEKDLRAMINFIVNNAKPFYQTIDNENDLDKFVQSRAASLVYYKPVGEEADKTLLQTFADLSVYFKPVSFAYVTSSELRSVWFVPDHLSIQFFSKKSIQLYEEDTMTFEKLKKFLENNLYPIVSLYDDFERDRIESQMRKALFFWDNDQTAAFRDHFVQLALEYQSRLQFVNIRWDDPVAEANFKGLLGTKLQIRGAIYMVDMESTTRHILPAIVGVGAVRDFIKTYSESERMELDEVDQGIIELTAQNYHLIVRSGPKDVIVFFYAPWCGHCQDFKSEYEKLAEAIQDQTDIVIAKVDYTKHKISDVEINHYPTILYYKKFPLTGVIRYHGEHSARAVLEWVQKNYDHDWVVRHQTDDITVEDL